MTYGSRHTPTELRQITKDRVVRITWNTGEQMELSMEYLRVVCPCADCRGHTPDQAKLIDGKQDVTITSITPVGRYAVKIAFSDNHDTGVYSWEMLWDSGVNKEALWQTYLDDLKSANKRRKPSVFAIKPIK
ncbi:MAG: DUF971 domain-containing protein [Magnetococcales bacterium]|nr:DUF971 domain-containing protein [Magnetococcales bacterium]MBF0323247.1 DUF971 domain-containing protein [Magnetococcales bacterium]